jgi:hypothetical protein
MTDLLLASLLCLAPPTGDASPDDTTAPIPSETNPDTASATDWDGPTSRLVDEVAQAPPSPSEEPPPEADPPAEASQSGSHEDEPRETTIETRTTATVVPEPRPTRPDRPIRYRIDLQLEGGTHEVAHRSFDAFSTSSTLGGVAAGVRVDYRLAQGRVFVGGGLSYRRFASARDLPYGSLATNVRVQEPLLFLRLSLMALEGVDLYLEPGGGPTIVDLEVTSSRTARQRTIAGTFNGLAGVALYLPKAWLPNKGASRVTAGLDFGLGYGWRSPISVRPSPETDDEPLATSSVPFGELVLRGAIWRAGLFIRFM